MPEATGFEEPVRGSRLDFEEEPPELAGTGETAPTKPVSEEGAELLMATEFEDKIKEDIVAAETGADSLSTEIVEIKPQEIRINVGSSDGAEKDEANLGIKAVTQPSITEALEEAPAATPVSRNFEQKSPPFQGSPRLENVVGKEIEVKTEVSSAEKDKIKDRFNEIGKKIKDGWLDYTKYLNSPVDDDNQSIIELSLGINAVWDLITKENGNIEDPIDPILITFAAIRNRLAMVEGGVTLQEKLSSENGDEASIIENHLNTLPNVGDEYRDLLKEYLGKLGEALENRREEDKIARELKGINT